MKFPDTNSDLNKMLTVIRTDGKVPLDQWSLHEPSPEALGLVVDNGFAVRPSDVILHDLHHIQGRAAVNRGNAKVRVFDAVDSTNSAMSRQAKEHDVVDHLYLAEFQNAGRGRRGKIWLGDYGRNIAMTVGCGFQCPMSDLGGLSCVAGLALVQVLEVLGIDAQLKWPNDVWVKDRKLAGILVELLQTPRGVVALIGIGLNVNISAQRIAEIDQDVTSLHGLNKEIGRDELVIQIFTSLLKNVDMFRERGFSPFISAFDAVHRLHNQPALMSAGTAIREGIVKGVDGNGALLFEDSGGISSVVSGEVSMRPAFLSKS